MNRRAFLLALGASAVSCARPRKHRYALRGTPRPHPTGGVECVFGVEDGTVTQTRRSPLAFRGDALLQRSGANLVRWDSRALKLEASWAIGALDCCVVQDGTFVALSVPARDAWALHRLDARGQVQTFIGSRDAEATFVLRALSRRGLRGPRA